MSRRAVRVCIFVLHRSYTSRTSARTAKGFVILSKLTHSLVVACTKGARIPWLAFNRLISTRCIDRYTFTRTAVLYVGMWHFSMFFSDFHPFVLLVVVVVAYKEVLYAAHQISSDEKVNRLNF